MAGLLVPVLVLDIVGWFDIVRTFCTVFLELRYVKIGTTTVLTPEKTETWERR